jgi:hypothetical protein
MTMRNAYLCVGGPYDGQLRISQSDKIVCYRHDTENPEITLEGLYHYNTEKKYWRWCGWEDVK